MNIIVSQKSQIPIYEQIYGQIVAQITNGELGEDYCLPSIRNVAKEIGVSVITVKKAWEMLEMKGFIYTLAGKGCFVKAQSGERDVDALISKRLKGELAYYKNLGVSLEELQILIKKLF